MKLLVAVAPIGVMPAPPDRDQLVGQIAPDQFNAALSSNLKNVVRMSTPVTIYNATVGGALVVLHDLNAVPNLIEVEPLIDARWWVDQDDRKVWTSSQITFHASHTGQYIVRAGVQ